MRFLSGFILSFLLASASCFAVETGSKAPDFTLKNLIGKQQTLSEFQGKVVFLDFWATWCAPCKNSLPWLSQLQSFHSNEDFSVVTVSLDQDLSEVQKFLKKEGLSLPVLLDAEGEVAELYQLPAMPSSFLISKDGTVLLKHAGFREADKRLLENEIQQALHKGS